MFIRISLQKRTDAHRNTLIVCRKKASTGFSFCGNPHFPDFANFHMGPRVMSADATLAVPTLERKGRRFDT